VRAQCWGEREGEKRAQRRVVGARSLRALSFAIHPTVWPCPAMLPNATSSGKPALLSLSLSSSCADGGKGAARRISAATAERVEEERLEQAEEDERLAKSRAEHALTVARKELRQSFHWVRALVAARDLCAGVARRGLGCVDASGLCCTHRCIRLVLYTSMHQACVAPIDASGLCCTHRCIRLA
jgi:hypothetical protein